MFFFTQIKYLSNKKANIFSQIKYLSNWTTQIFSQIKYQSNKQTGIFFIKSNENQIFFVKILSNKLNLESFIKYGSNNHKGIFKISYKSNKEKKGGLCELPIKIFPQLYTIHGLKQHKMLVAHD